jgi:putative DNA primase/helicase
MLQNSLHVNTGAPSEVDIDRIEDAISHISPDCDRETWVKIGQAIHAALDVDGFDVWDQWSRGGSSYKAGDARDVWKSFKPGGGIGIGTLFHLAKEVGWTPPSAGQQAKQSKSEYLYAKARRDISGHPYTIRKGLKHCAMVRRIEYLDHDCLVVPMYSPAGEITGLQFISPDKVFGAADSLRDKTMLKDSVKGLLALGSTFRGANRVVICEGLATADAIVEATGLPLVVAFDKGSLKRVALQIKELANNGADLIIAADDDGPDPDGVEKAIQAAQACGGRVALPGLGRKADFWDVFHEIGADAVRDAIEAAQAPKSTQYPKKNAPTLLGPVWPEFVPFEKLPPDLPEGLLPGILGEFAEGLAEATQTPRELAAVNALGVAALCVQDKAIVRVKPDYSEGLNLYGIVASEPGERKSAVVAACKAPLVAWEQEQEQQIQSAILEAVSVRKTMEKAIEKARGKAAGAKTSEERKTASREVWEMERELPEIPPLPRLLVDDITPEALAAIMASSGESLGMLEAEGGALDTFSGRYSNSIPNIDLLLKAFGAERTVVDRKGKDPIRLHNPRLTMILTPQPSVLKAAGSNPTFVGRGLIARCILVMPKPRVGFRDNSRTIDPRLSNQWSSLVEFLLGIPQRSAPHEIRLSESAYQAWVDFSQLNESSMRPGGENEFMRAWASKLTGLVVRLAGIFHLADGGGEDGEIRECTMRQACKFGLWAVEHARHAFSAFGVDEGQEGAKRILDWLRKERRESATAREIFVALRGRYPRMEQIRPGLDMLIEHGALVPGVKAAASPKGGRPTETYMVNPAIYL